MERARSIITYGFNKEEKNLIEVIRIKHKVKKVIYVSNKMGDSVIKDILNEIFIVADEVNLPDQKLLIFDQFSDKDLSVIVDAVRSTIPGHPIMATVTPISINWSLNYLLQHLIQEREEFKLRKMMKNL